jgi:hypothetical protein
MNGLMRGLAVLFGVLLLLPGLCTIAFSTKFGVGVVGAICFLVRIFGVLLLVWALSPRGTHGDLRDGLAQVLVVGLGIVVLLAGLCSLGLMALFLPEMLRSARLGDWPPMLAWLVCLAISVGGILLIRAGVKMPGGRANESLPTE